ASRNMTGGTLPAAKKNALTGLRVARSSSLQICRVKGPNITGQRLNLRGGQEKRRHSPFSLSDNVGNGTVWHTPEIGIIDEGWRTIGAPCISAMTQRTSLHKLLWWL